MLYENQIKDTCQQKFKGDFYFCLWLHANIAATLRLIGKYTLEGFHTTARDVNKRIRIQFPNLIHNVGIRITTKLMRKKLTEERRTPAEEEARHRNAIDMFRDEFSREGTSLVHSVISLAFKWDSTLGDVDRRR